VHQLDGACRRLNLVFRQTQGARGGEQQCRPYALAAAQYAVAHGLVQACRNLIGLGKARRESVFHAQLPGFELRAEYIGTRGLVLRPDATIGCVVHALMVS
jgi:hypothetical protein